MNNDQVILITGTRKGIGRYLAHYYCDRGYRVFGCSRGPVDYVLAGYQHFCLDVSDELQVKHMFSEINGECARLDVLVNNAGVASMNHSLLTPIKTVHSILNTNVVGTFLCCREAVKLMRGRDFGRIINFASFAVPFKLEGEAIYAASKAAVITLTEVLAREYAGFGVTVNAVAPPAIETDLIRGVPKQKLQNLLGRQAIHRYGHISEVCNVIDFLNKPESGIITGQTIYLGGI